MSISLILQTLLSTAAVMATVLVILFVVTGIGLLTSFSWQQVVGVRIRSAIWLGWFWVAVYVSTAHLFFAMKPPVAVPLIIAGLIGWFLLIRKSGFPHFKLRGQPWWIYGAWTALFALFVLLSNQTLRAPIFNFDAGWFRIPFVTWASNFPAAPGLSNLNLYFGYGHFTDIVSALLGRPFFDGSGYRLVALVFLLAFGLDVVLRIIAHPGSKCPRTWMLPTTFAGLSLISLLVITPNSSVWISTPIVDLPVAVMFLSAVAYQLEATQQNKKSLLLVTFFLLSLVSVLRPPYLIAWLILIVFSLYSYQQRRKSRLAVQGHHWWKSSVPVLAVSALFTSYLAGTYLRTGYPLFPFSRVNLFAPDWSIPLNIMQEARAYNQNYSLAVWVAPDALVDSYVSPEAIFWAAVNEPVLQLVFGFSLITVGMLFVRRLSFQGHDGAITDNVVTPAVLFFSSIAVVIGTGWAAPNPKYFWGPLLSIGLLPVCVLLEQMRGEKVRFKLGSLTLEYGSPVLVVMLIATLTIVAVQKGYVGSALLNPVMANGPGPLGSQTSSQAVGEVLKTDSGLEVFIASKDGQCWQQEPPCSFTLDERLELRGETLREGFRIRQ